MNHKGNEGFPIPSYPLCPSGCFISRESASFWQRGSTSAHKPPSIEMEIHFDLDSSGDGIAILHAWGELPLFDGFDSFFIETHSQRARDLHVAGMAGRIDHEGKHYAALQLNLTGLFRVIRFGIV